MTSNVFPSLSLSVNKEKFDPSDVFYALHELHHLTEALVAHMAEMDFGTGDDRNHALDRAYGLAKIVSDHVILCSKLAEPFDGPGKWECKR